MMGLIIGIIITLLFSAFFSGMEIAFVSSNKMLAEMDREEKNGLSQKALHRFYVNSNNFISTLLVGNNIALVVYGILIAKLFDNTIFEGMPASITVPADTILSTCIVIVTGEFLPKTLFKINPNRTVTTFAVPSYMIYVILYPISRFATALAHGLLRLFGAKIDNEKNKMAFTKVDLDHLVQSSIDNAKDDGEIADEVKIFQNALDFSDTKVRDCMIPRNEIVAIDVNQRPSKLLDMFVESGKSKIIVFDGDIDNILGYIHSSEMFKHPIDCSTISKSELKIIQMPIVPEVMAARKMMQMLIQEKKTIGIVVDEVGGTSGIVALEDLVEEIFGEIEDEHDNSNEILQQISDNEYQITARTEISRVNETFGLDLPEGDEFITIGGLILNECGTFPKLNEEVQIGDYNFKILKSSATKIELVRLKVE